MNKRLVGKRIAILVENGFNQGEYICLKSALENSGAEIETISPSTEVRAWTETSWGDLTKLDKHIDQAHRKDFDGLIIPGGVLHLEKLKISPASVKFVRAFLEEGLPVAAFNEGVSILNLTGEIAGLHLTSLPRSANLLTDVGAHWEEAPIVVDHGLVTGTGSDHLNEFCEKVVNEFASELGPAQVRLPKTLQTQVLH